MADTYERHKPIRNKLRTYEPHSVIAMAIRKLRSKIDYTSGPAAWEGYRPWHIFLLLRWLFQYTEPAQGLKPISEGPFIDLLNDIGDLDNQIILDGEPEEQVVHKFVRRQWQLQLPYQLRDYDLMSASGRQLVLFQRLGAKYGINEQFTSISNLSLKEFFEIFHACIAACIAKNADRLSVEYFNDRIPRDKIFAFFELLSDDLDSAKRRIRDHTHPKSTVSFQINEHTPLSKRPFFKVGGRYIPYSARLLRSSFTSCAYDIFKLANPQFSRDAFGDIFETYIGMAAAYAGTGAITKETGLRALVPPDTKVPDFLIEEENSAIFIEAKSTELHPIARVLQGKDSMLKNAQDSILNGTLQILITAHHLSISNRIKPDTAKYGIVVTYKDYLIGDAEYFWNNIAGDYFSTELSSIGISAVIRPERLYYMSCADFDWLVAGAKEKGLKISEILDAISARNKDDKTLRISTGHHLEEMWGEHFRPTYLREATESCFENLMHAFR